MRARALAAGLTYLLLCSLTAGCGDDEGGSSDGGAATGGAGGTGGGGNGGMGGRPVLPEPDGGAGDAGPLPVGEEVEGGPCATAADCGLSPETGVQLSCVNSGGFGVCARGCETDEDCGTEVCDSPYTGFAEDAHCIDLVNVEFGRCGGIDTALCASEAGLTCFLYSDLPLGVCMTQCVAAADDAGVTDSICKSDQECITSAVGGGDGTEGVCGTRVGRGDECGSEGAGKFCGDEDICAPDDPESVDSPITCHQRCTRATDPCDEGACLQFRTSFYCR